MKKILIYLLILSLLVNIPLPAFAQSKYISAGQDTTIPTALTGIENKDGSENSLPQTDKDRSVSKKVYEDMTNIEQQPPINDEHIVLDSYSHESVESFKYGHSAFYNTLKEKNKLDILDKTSK
ncbi:hypothetical protein L7E55_14765 [Pelotomaculum isophthalicicum JI]|uniref:Uncharacterized protein n=1 Tax=Pelotomaculum isophthalicicum JI TaxID=947010 RepID=A0A9X4JWP5_9FIRM|nr:hypothetical protein [Pelotomaculum isophthalicicum]MDF9409598.1 hypothetical protein [Pelotomaculum isophthalicicum JI]